MRVTVKAEDGAVLIDELDDRATLAPLVGAWIEELIDELEPSGGLSVPKLTTWTVVVSH